MCFPPRRPVKRTSWVVDSGATLHCVSDRKLLTYTYDCKPVRIRVADNRVIESHAVGASILKMRDQHGRIHVITLHNVVYHPHFADNLLSVRRMWKDNRISTKFKNTNFFKTVTGDKFQFAFNRQYKTETVHMAKLDPDILHSRFGHPHPERLRKMRDRSINFPKTTEMSFNHRDCDACHKGGAKRKPFAKVRSTPFTYFGEQLQSDICGPFPKSLEGFRYLLNIVDGFTNELTIYPLKTKESSEIRTCLDRFLKDNRAYLPSDPRKPITWHTDNGGEFMSTDLNTFCEEFAIHRSFSVPYCPPQNAHAERMWGVILRSMRIMLAESGVHVSFWMYAARHACHLHNILPSSKLTGEKSPYEMKYQMKPDVDKLRVWGCQCWYFLPEHERTSKISARALPAVHLGRDYERNGYIVYVPDLNRITSAYHVSFQERKFLTFTPIGIANKPKRIDALHDHADIPLYRDDNHETQPHRDSDPHIQPQHTTDESDEDDNAPEMCDDPGCSLPKHDDKTPHSYERRRSPRLVDTPTPDYTSREYARSDFGSHRTDGSQVVIVEDVNGHSLVVRTEDILTNIKTPDSYEEAIGSRYKPRWEESMNKEITDLIKNNTWEYVREDKIPKGHRITKSKWVYKIKLKRDNTIDRFKSRFVACGYSQIKGIDWDESFSATLRATSFRTLLAIAAGEKLTLEHFDISNAFTEADIDKLIFVAPPKGFVTRDTDGMRFVLKLKKALYGTKQASRMWQLTLRDYLVNKMGFKNSAADPCLFSRRDPDNSVILVGIYVDDLIVACSNDRKLEWFKKELSKRFRARHEGRLSYFLGVSIDQSKNFDVSIHQRSYIEKLVERFIPAKTPSKYFHAHSMPCQPESFQRLTTAQSDDERDHMLHKPYLQLIGSLLYLSTMTRPDIAYHMSVLCSVMHDPSPESYYAAIDLLLYVSKTCDYTFTFSGRVDPPSALESSLHAQVRRNHGLVAYSDSSFRKPNSLGYSMFGYVVYLFGAPISFTSKRLKVVALSSAEAEYAAASYTCKELVFVRNILLDLGLKLDGPIVLAVDNQAAIAIAKNHGATKLTKHFDDAVHYFRDSVDRQRVVPTFVRTHAQRADGFTKPLGKGLYRDWCGALLNISSSSSKMS